jgi:zinc D-Ala-D-Ala carboxypeptidase
MGGEHARIMLSSHFTLDELTFSSTAVLHGIDNSPSPTIAARLFSLAHKLELVRLNLGGHPLHIDSGYRCPELNQLLRGVPNSAHVDGDAADFICPAFGTPLEIVRYLQTVRTLNFDQLIQEGNWVHISFAPAARGQVLTAHFVDGKAHYTEGVEAVQA